MSPADKGHRAGEAAESSRYELLVKVASGGMGSVYVARSRGALGFENLVAVKRPHAHLLETTSFRATLVGEARIASRVRHANVVSVRDVTFEGSQIYLVMDYIEGASLAQLADAPQDRRLLPVPVTIRVCMDAAAGLHAAHEARNDAGELLGLVHRDVSPQNILIGTDGIARLTDFGIAKCLADAREQTAEGLVKGKLSYIAPEYLRGDAIDRRSDVFGLGAVLWETLTGERLFRGSNDAETVARLLSFEPPPPSTLRAGVPPGVDDVILRAVAKLPSDRYPTAEAFGEALEAAARAGSAVAMYREVAATLRARVGRMLESRASAVRAAMLQEPTANLEPAREALPSTEYDEPASPVMPVADTDGPTVRDREPPEAVTNLRRELLSARHDAPAMAMSIAANHEALPETTNEPRSVIDTLRSTGSEDASHPAPLLVDTLMLRPVHPTADFGRTMVSNLRGPFPSRSMIDTTVAPSPEAIVAAKPSPSGTVPLMAPLSRSPLADRASSATADTKRRNASLWVAVVALVMLIAIAVAVVAFVMARDRGMWPLRRREAPANAATPGLQ